jgi:hypothetical protein
MITLSVVALQGEGCSHDRAFEGNDLTAIEDISICAGTENLFLSYTPPDSTITRILKLDSDCKDVQSYDIDSLLSPSIGIQDMTVYCAGIRDTEIVITTFSLDLEKREEVSFSLEEPVDVCILPTSDSIYLSYVDRFFEEGLMRQDIFIKKLDHSFAEIAHNRITFDYFWEEPSLAMYHDVLYLAYASSPLMSFLNRHIVLHELDSHLAVQNEKRIPVESTPDKNIFQPSLTDTETGLLLFYRIAADDFTISKFTWDGMITVRVGNIRGVPLTPDLSWGEEIIVTQDCWEQYTPAVESAFGKVYLSYAETHEESQHLRIISAPTPIQLKQDPPPWWETSMYWLVIPAGILIGSGLLVYHYRKNRKKKSGIKKKEN